MADEKISALTSATLPLAGTEVVPLVQSSTTKKVAVSDLTAGRDVQANNVLVNLTSAPGAFNNTVAVSSGASALAGFHCVNNAVGSAYNTGLQVFLNGADGYVSSFNGPLYIQTGGYNIRAEYDLSGNYKVNNGNVIVGTAGKGIDFSANGGDVLSQYDEGTWTPADFSGAGLSLTAAGSYTRVGRMVFFSAEITYPVTANAAWAAINGLPFVRSAGAIGGGATISAGALAGYTFPLLSGATGGYLFKIADQGTHALNSDLSGQTIQISGSYTV